jgi:hypothetical protein
MNNKKLQEIRYGAWPWLPERGTVSVKAALDLIIKIARAYEKKTRRRQ